MSPHWILSVALALFFLQNGEGYSGKANLRIDITCTVRTDWCFNLTIVTVVQPTKTVKLSILRHVPMPAFAMDKKVLEKSFCWYNHVSVHPMFKNVELPSPTKLGALVSYQVSHTCSTDKKPDCVFLDYGFYAPFGEETKFPPHELGIEQGRGECPDWKVKQ